MMPLGHHFSMEPRGDSLEALKVWQKALDLMVECHRIRGNLPSRARRIGEQLERCSSAIPANIAEGHGRARKNELLRSIEIARGELRESQSWLESIHRLGYAKDDDLKRARDLAVEVARMLGGLRRYLLNRGDDARPSH
jgi:four helix bundle protein